MIFIGRKSLLFSSIHCFRTIAKDQNFNNVINIIACKYNTLLNHIVYKASLMHYHYKLFKLICISTIT